jgi:hypothetical protein
VELDMKGVDRGKGCAVKVDEPGQQAGSAVT